MLYRNRMAIAFLSIATISAGCAANTYKPPPSAKLKHEYQREQLKSPVAKQAGGAAIAGVVGGLLGPIGVLVTAVGSATAQVTAISAYLSQMNDATIVGEIIEDVSDRRNAEFKSNPRWFKSLPNPLPRQFNVDLGSGNSFIFPIADNLQLEDGDLVTIVAPGTVDRLAKARADFSDLPLIVNLRCKKMDVSCKQRAENELGIVERK